MADDNAWTAREAIEFLQALDPDTKLYHWEGYPVTDLSVEDDGDGDYVCVNDER